MNLRNFRNPRIYAVAHRQDQDGIFLLTSSTEKIGWTQISKISSKRMTSKHYPISSRVWGNFLLLFRPHKKGLIFDPYTGRAWPFQKTSCQHVACSSSVTDRDIICAGIPGPSVCLFDFHENSWLSAEHHLPQNPTASFSFKNQSYLLVFRGDFFDLVHVVSTVTKRLNTFPSPLRYKKQFKITNIEQIKVIQDAETSNRSAKIQVIYDTLKPAKNSSHMVHFSATLEFDGTKPFTTLLTLDMENYRLMEFTHFHPDTRQLDVRFKKSLEWPLWKRLPILKNPILKRNQLFALSSSFCRKNVDGLDVMTIQDRFGEFDISSIGIFYQK
ncbi:Oidioi.mRNA.OKI2018_I69.chr2.g5257.t1.cds [Oikopleura dioica]|uniref:Oidioi.mRNA.OKI2018_I69.chr2.g5257.t1.cds n=1 Tax=Oikopleura dioica TaxID=34765 RepID=A0ABN7T5Q4_OIKDI|nr:Oidioi.mRNA.OKI2018_I69.chr2.g5257.t1.cds [Oikopleura dioica]